MAIAVVQAKLLVVGTHRGSLFAGDISELGNDFPLVANDESSPRPAVVGATGASKTFAAPVVALAVCEHLGVIFCLRAHRELDVRDISTFALLTRYSSELVSCGTQLSAVRCVSISSASQVLLLGGTDGSFCARRLTRVGGRLHCMLLPVPFDPVDYCPVSSIDYNASQGVVLLGNAGCGVSVVSDCKEALERLVEGQQRFAEASAAGEQPSGEQPSEDNV